MYFLAKNLRACSRPLRRSAPSILISTQKYVPIDFTRFTRYTSSCIHPEQMKRLIKERDANMLCRFFDSEEYKNRVSTFLKTQSKLMSTETTSKIQQPNEVKIQHILSCAQPNIPKKKVKAQKQTEEVKQEIVGNKKAKKAAKISTVLEKLMKTQNKETNLKCDIQSNTATIQPLTVPKKIRTKTTIMPIFLKKLKFRNVKSAEDAQEEFDVSNQSKNNTDDLSEGGFDPHSAAVLHRSNLSSRGLKTMAQRKGSKISTTLIPRRQAKSMNLKSYSQLLVTKPVKNTVYDMNSDSCLYVKNREQVQSPRVEVVRTKITDGKAQWPPKSSKKIENVNLQKFTLDMLMSEIQKTEKNDNLERKNTIKMILSNTVKVTKPKRRELAFCNLFEQVKMGTMKKQQTMATIHTIPKYAESEANSVKKILQKEKSYQTPESFTYKIVSRVKKCREKELKDSFEVKSFRHQNRCFLKGSIKSEGSSKKQSDVESTKAAMVSCLSRKPFIGNIVTSKRVQPLHLYGYHTCLTF